LSPGDERYERLKHQVTFLHDRELTSSEMDDWNRQLWLLERLVGRDPGKLDPQLRERLHDELEKATVAQLKATGLMDEWLDAWEGYDEASEAPLSIVPTYAPSPPPRIPHR
jgi:hypothetical protein